MKQIIKKGATDVSLIIFINDSASTTGTGKTGIVYNAAGLVCYYVRPGSTAAALTLATQTVTGAHADGGFVEVDATNMPGVYRLDLSDAIVASGVNSVVIMLKGATGMAPVLIELELVAYDPQDSAALGLSRLDAAVTTRASQASVDTVDDFLDTEIAAIKAKTDGLPTDPADASDIAAAFAALTTKVDTIDDFLDTEIAAIKAKTDGLPSDPADASDIAASFATVNSSLSTIAGFIDTEVSAIKAKTDALPTDPADQSAVEAAITAATAALATAADLATLTGYVDTEVAAIKAKTDNLPAAPAATGDIPTANQNRDALLAAIIETGFTLTQVLRIISAAVAGKTTTAGQNPEVFRSLDDSANRLSVTNDASGNRSAITYNA